MTAQVMPETIDFVDAEYNTISKADFLKVAAEKSAAAKAAKLGKEVIGAWAVEYLLSADGARRSFGSASLYLAGGDDYSGPTFPRAATLEDAKIAAREYAGSDAAAKVVKLYARWIK